MEYSKDYRLMKAVPYLIVFCVVDNLMLYPAGMLLGMLKVTFMYWFKFFINTQGETYGMS